jgi:hypothetical protein
MRKIVLGAALCLAPLTAAHAQTMTVATFLAKAEALKKKGAMAVFSSDIGLSRRRWKAAASNCAPNACRAEGRRKARLLPAAGRQGFGQFQ